MNVLADVLIEGNDSTTNSNSTPLIYYQKLEAKHKKICNFISAIITKQQNKLAMN